jgi:hypothetical protein
MSALKMVRLVVPAHGYSRGFVDRLRAGKHRTAQIFDSIDKRIRLHYSNFPEDRECGQGHW